MKSTSLLLFLVSCLGVSCGRRTAQEPAPVDIQTAWTLAFVRDGNIWVAAGDGTAQRLLITNGDSPAWSPNRKQIAFSRDCNLWVAASDGSNERALTREWKSDNPDMCVLGISWNPKLLFITFSHRESYSVKSVPLRNHSFQTPGPSVVEMIGTSIFDVATNADNKLALRFGLEGGTSFVFADHGSPAWSHSGHALAFSRNGDVWLAEMEEDSQSNWTATRIAAVASYDEPTMRGSRQNLGAVHLSWSPDDKHIVYSKVRLQGSGFAEIHVLDTSSGNDRMLTDDGLDPSFSPDGQFIVYWTNFYPPECDGGRSLCVWAISLDGSRKRMLVSKAIHPAW